MHTPQLLFLRPLEAVTVPFVVLKGCRLSSCPDEFQPSCSTRLDQPRSLVRKACLKFADRRNGFRATDSVQWTRIASLRLQQCLDRQNVFSKVHPIDTHRGLQLSHHWSLRCCTDQLTGTEREFGHSLWRCGLTKMQPGDRNCKGETAPPVAQISRRNTRILLCDGAGDGQASDFPIWVKTFAGYLGEY